MPTVKFKDNNKLDAYFTIDSFHIEGKSSKLNEQALKWADDFRQDKVRTLFHFGFSQREAWFSPALVYVHRISMFVIKRITQETELESVREQLQLHLSETEIQSLMETVPFVLGMEYIDKRWIEHMSALLLGVFKLEIQAYEGSVAQYFSDQHSNLNIVGKVFFHLVENKDEDYPFAFMATYSTKEVRSRKAIHTPLKHALKEFDGDEKRLLQLISTVMKVSETSVFIQGLINSGELFYPIRLNKDEAYIVLKEMAMYEEAGILCRVPDWWRKQHNILSVSIKMGEKEPSKVGFDALLDFKLSLSLGDEVLSEQDVLELLEMAEGLTLYKGKWVEVNRSKLNAALEAFAKLKDINALDGLSLKDAMRLEFQLNALNEEGVQDLDVSITNGHWLREFKDRLMRPSQRSKIKVAHTFLAKLRHYQMEGYQWLHQMSQFGFGALLADDMGLGKTIQVIAYLEHVRLQQGGRVLLIVPASLLGNWQKELEKFAPLLDFQIFHQSSVRVLADIDCFLTITSYGMASRLESLHGRVWDCVILDEAQAIKNPSSKLAKAIKAIPSKMRIALTGTPIENHLSELWSLFDFLNQGLLGTPREFSRFTKSLAEDMGGYTQLRRLIQPFILRRLKTDKAVIKDLPDKLEMNTFTRLSSKQIVLYKQVLGQIEAKLADVDGIARKGLVLSSILKLKQICNHPDHYLSLEDYKEDQSGKFEMLRELCETIYVKRERVLVFTQFREIVEPLSAFLASIFETEGLVLHGGTAIKKRSALVERFNGDDYVPYMVLSVKAGGVGLNLTAANHVIHFDRWWNPAIENQATDRAFRIGQKKKVMVYKFITQGTIEEKIDTIIRDKHGLSNDVLSSGSEHWITEYSNEALMQLFTLGGEA